MAKHKAPGEPLHHDRLGTVFHHLHKALLELELLLREEAVRKPPDPAPAPVVERPLTPHEDAVESLRRRGLDPVFSTNDVVKALGISVENLNRLIERGEGPPRIKLSPRRWGYPLSKLEQWKASRSG